VTVATAVRLRALASGDRTAVEQMTRGTGLFHDNEVAIAVEVFDAAVAGTSDYEAMGAEVGGALAGWICWGPTPCTLGTWDCYWIVVDAAHQGEGIGSALLSDMEQRLEGRARLIVAETAGRDDYAPTRVFYERRGYHAQSRIPDFYAPGDDQVVYVKYLSAAARP
jgi:GNAT superfamily N-acetyltransferase